MKSEKLKAKGEKRKIFGFWLLVLTFALCLFNSEGYAKPVSSVDLIEHAKDYDGKTISFQGEVVGEIMRRGDFAWINIHDGQNALGIWAKSPLAAPVTFTGSYKSTGDIIEVQGVFHRACLEHGGDLDIHADTLTVVKPGQKRIEEFRQGQKKLVLVLIGAAVCLLILRALLKR